MVNTQKFKSQLPFTVKAGFSETFLFSEITFWKKKTLTSLDNYSASRPSSGITFQNKGKVLDTVQQLEYFSLNCFTTTRVCMHTPCIS